MRTLSIATALVAFAATACERKTEAPSAPAPAASAEIAAIDEFGPFEAEVRGVAFWTHPAVPFNGLIVVATGRGLAALNVEDGAEVARTEEFDAGGASIFYDGVFSLAEDEGAAGARGIVVAFDRGAKQFRFFAIDNATRAMNELAVSGPAPSDVDAFCAGPQFKGPPRLVVLNDKTMTTLDVVVGGASVTIAPTHLTDLRETEFPGPAAGCTVGKSEGELFVLLQDGRILRYLEHTRRREEQFATTSASEPAGINLIGFGSALDGDESDCCGALAVLDRKDARVRLLDYDDGAALGSVTLKASFDVEGVAAATAFGVGDGNFGGVYRDGVVALATDGERPSLRLAPFNAVASSLGFKAGEARNPRTQTPQPLEYQCAELERRGARPSECDEIGRSETLDIPLPAIPAPDEE
jgi:hypothetical protein